MDALDEVLLTEDEIDARVCELGETLTEKLPDDLLVVGVLRGCVTFLGDLIRHLDCSMTLDFMDVSRGGSVAGSERLVRLHHGPRDPVEDRHVLVVEDIVDGGYTLNYLMGYFVSRGVASLHTCALLDKPEGRRLDVDPDYHGFEVPNRFLVGYGLDYRGRFRNLPCIGVMDETEDPTGIVPDGDDPEG